MKHLTLRTVDGGALDISKIVLGTSSLHTVWRKLGEEGTFAYIDRYRELGGEIIDTGRTYGGETDQISFGLCESILSRYMKSRRCEGSLRIITKGGFPDLDTRDLHMVRFRMTREAVLGDFYTSYDRLQKGPIDIYLLHRDAPEKPVAYLMDLIHEIAQTGLVRVIGVSNWSLDRILEGNAYARSRGQTEIAVSELMWSYAYTDVVARRDATLSIMNPALYRQYLEHPIPIISFSSQARGLFSMLYRGAYRWEEVAEKNSWYAFPENEVRWHKIRTYCDRTGQNPAAVALAYLTSNPVACAPIVGCQTEAELSDSLSDPDLTLTEAELRWFDDLG